jgi:hypothetical protein
MTEPLPEAAFEVLMERAGLLDDMTPEEREDIRLATHLAARFAQRVRTPAPVAPEVEPASVFSAQEPSP